MMFALVDASICFEDLSQQSREDCQGLPTQTFATNYPDVTSIKHKNQICQNARN